MKANRIIILLLSLIIFSCAEQAKKGEIMVDGKFQNAQGIKVMFGELDVDSLHNLDSIVLDETGLFRFRFNPPETGFYIIKSSSGEYILLLSERNEVVNIFADLKKRPFNYQVGGSPGSTLLKEFYDHTLINLVTADSLRSALMENRESPDFYQLSLSFDSLFQKLIDQQKIIEKTFIQQNPNSLASLIVLNYKFGMTPVLDPEEDFQVFLKLDSTLSTRYPSNKHVVFHHQRVVEHERQEMERQTLKKPKP
jgi:hypothetical protein